MKRSNIAAAAAAACACLLLWGCASAQTESETVYTGSVSEEPEYQAKLDLIEPSAYAEADGLDLEPGSYISVLGRRSDTAYWEQIQAGVEQAADDLNDLLGYSGSDKIKVLFNAPSGTETIDEQVNILDEELARYPDVVAISSIDETASQVQFDLAAENGIPIVAFDSGNEYQGIQCLCKTDDTAAGTELAVRISEAASETGEVILFVHDSTSESARERTAAFLAEIEENHPGITVAETLYLDNLDEKKIEIAAEELGYSAEDMPEEEDETDEAGENEDSADDSEDSAEDDADAADSVEADADDTDNADADNADADDAADADSADVDDTDADADADDTGSADTDDTDSADAADTDSAESDDSANNADTDNSESAEADKAVDSSETDTDAGIAEDADGAETADTNEIIETNDTDDTSEDAASALSDEVIEQIKEAASAMSNADVLQYYLEKYPNLKGLAATDESSTEDALDALDDAGLTGSVTLMGFGAGSTLTNALGSGSVSGLIVENPFGIGYAAVIAAARTVLEEGNEAVVDTGYVWVTAHNMEDEEISALLY